MRSVAPRMGAAAEAIDPGRSVSSAKPWRGIRASRTSLLRCRGLAPGADHTFLARRGRRKNHYLPRVGPQGSVIAAFALSEPDAGSDVAALRCSGTAGW